MLRDGADAVVSSGASYFSAFHVDALSLSPSLSRGCKCLHHKMQNVLFFIIYIHLNDYIWVTK